MEINSNLTLALIIDGKSPSLTAKATSENRENHKKTYSGLGESENQDLKLIPSLIEILSTCLCIHL